MADYYVPLKKLSIFWYPFDGVQTLMVLSTENLKKRMQQECAR